MDPAYSNLSQSKYVISLDAIDLNFIPTTSSCYRGREVTQIWTKGNLDLRENEYFEFEIKENGSEANNADNGNVQYDYTTCHICNIEVPKPYLKDHVSSKKHKTFKKILDISLDRLKKVINNVEVFEDTNIIKSDSVYLCTSCVAVVNKDENISHEKTVTHKYSLRVDKILNDFLNLYDNDKYNYDNAHDVKETSIVHNTKGKDKIDEVVDYFPRAINLYTSSTDVYEKIGCTAVTPELKKDLYVYIDFLKSTTHLKDVNVLEDNYLEIIALSGIRVKISADNFNGIKNETIMNRCILCRKSYAKDLNWEHLYEKQHVDHVSKPFVNQDCFRNITTDLSHCAVCNMNICTSDQQLHITLYEKHKLHLQKALQIDIVDVTTKPSQVHEALSTHNDGDDQVASTPKTKNNQIESNIQTIPIKESEFNNGNDTHFCENVPDDYNIHVRTHKIDEVLEKSEIHYLMCTTDSEHNLLCNVCNTMILNNDMKVEEHLKSLYHSANYKKMLELNNINEFVKYHFHCKSCEVCFVKTKEIIHINSKQHEKYENVFTTEIQAKTQPKASPLPVMVLLKCRNNIINGNSFRCITCNINITNHNYNIYTHLISALHIKAVTELTSDEVTYIHYHINLTNYPNLSCMVCNVQLTMNQNNILTHVNGNTHKNLYKLTLKDNKMVKQNNGYICKLCDVSLGPMKEFVHCCTKKHKYLLAEYQNKANKDVESTSKILNKRQTKEIKTYLLEDFKDNPKKIFCIVCNVIVPKTVNNITEHLEGVNHRSLYEFVLEENNIIKCCNDFECKLCEIYIVTGREYNHISTKLHQDKRKDARKYECFICKVKLTNNDENIRLHNFGEQHVGMIELATQNNIRIYNDKCFCEICEKVIENESVSEHLKSILHITSSYFQDK